MKKGFKKGMSPLIATILLMAFAVAIGGMIINWSSSISTNYCEGAKIQVLKSCFDDNNIYLTIKNVGSKNIDALSLEFDYQGIITEVKIPDSALPKGNFFKKKIPLIIKKGSTINIKAGFLDHNKIEYCKPIYQAKIDEC